ncbi:hypothetical protein [Marinobacter sp.]|uniref:hypothetical protein n=1 Tax=Marinobacter sp. TaxID=50741 RepID=UPI00257BBD9C|nr:hypothetical protein [Marinobacter sp.]
MNRMHHPRLWQFLMILIAAFIISGCSGGSSGGNPTSESPETPPDDSATVSGTAAAGAPLVGFVGAKDASDNTATADINANGAYELDLSELTTPVLIYGSGISGGNAYQLLSVVFEDDLDGTVNITPLTDLIVANAGGRTPQEIFNNPDFTQLTQEAIQTQESAIKARLKPLLDGLGVDEDFDLRNSAFAADRSGFDAVLDVIEVTVNTDTNSATIRDRISNQTIENSFTQPSADTTPIEVDETTLNEGVSAVQALNTLISGVAAALENANGDALQALVTDDFLNNGESTADFQARLIDTDSDASREDAIELAQDFRNWSLAELTETGARINIGSPQGPLEVVNDNGEWKLKGNGLEYFVFVEPTHLIANGATEPTVTGIGTMIFASNPTPDLGDIANSTMTISGDLTVFNGNLQGDGDRFGRFEVLGPNDIPSPATVSFAWSNSTTGITDSPASFTLRRGTPDFTNGAPEITSASADLGADQYTFAWTLPPGYESVSVRNNFTGQQSGGVGESEDPGFVGNALANEARSYTGALPEGYVPSNSDELRLIARDQFGVFVATRVINPFADQVPPASEPGALIGSFIKRNTDRADNAPYIHFSFFESGHYIHLELGDDFRPDDSAGGNTGMEMGTYSWDSATGAFEFTEVLIDQNGEWGASDIVESEPPLNVVADADGFTLSFASGESEQFERVPENANAGGVVGTWVTQNPSNLNEVQVFTFLEDGYYFIGDAYLASGDEVPGLEFGEWSWDSDTLELVYSAEYDQNGAGGLANSGNNNRDTLLAIVEGLLVVDNDRDTQFSELVAGNPVTQGDLTVDYTPPANDSDPGNEVGPAITGDFHYLRSAAGIEGERPSGPGTVFMASYRYLDASLSDNGDDTGTLNYTNACLSDLLVEAGINAPPLFDASAGCQNASGAVGNVQFTQNGAIMPIPDETFAENEDDVVNLGPGDVNLFATNSARHVLLGFGQRTFEYEDGDSFTSGVETGVHMLAAKGSGMVAADMAGSWGMITMQLSAIEEFADDIAYNVNSLDISVDNAGALTIEQEEFFEIIQGGNTSNMFISPETETIQGPEEIGNLSLTDDGELSLFGGELAGFVSPDQDMFFLTGPDPRDDTVPQDAGFQELLIGVRQGSTPLQAADLVGKEYARFGQFYWVQSGFFEVDYARPGSTLTFPVDSGIAEYRRDLEFSFTGFDTNSPVVDGESANTVGYDFEYSVDANGQLRLTGENVTTNYTDQAVELGWANADATVIVMTNYYVRVPDDGTGPSGGGVGISVLICTNCN